MKTIKMIVTLISLTSPAFLFGCAENAIYHVVVEGYPVMAKEYVHLTPVGQNDARLILYWPEKSFFQGSAIRIMIDSENGAAHSLLGYRTAEILDLPAGEYTMGLSKNKKRIGLEALPGKTYCYNVTEIKTWSDQKEEGIKPPGPIPLEECIQSFSRDDIRCAHKECLVKTVVPKTPRTFRRYHPNLDEDQLKAEAKNFDIPKDVARIYITRRLYTLGMVRVGVDGKPEIRVGSSSFVVYEVVPGEHTVISAIGGPHNIEQAFRISVAPGECCFFHSDTFRFLDTEQGRELVRDYDLIDGCFFKE